MLNITFNIHTGQWSPIPNDTHYISIVGYKKLTTNQQYLLRNYIVKHHLDISLKEATHHHHHFSVQKSLKNYNYLYQKVKPCDLDPWICSIAGYSSYSCSPYLFMCPIIRLVTTTLCFTIDCATFTILCISKWMVTTHTFW